jgi:hypothetical protein
MIGNGKMIFNTSMNTYEGSFLNNEINGNGEGTFKIYDGSTFKGTFQDGQI